jgi:hypothetical protein
MDEYRGYCVNGTGDYTGEYKYFDSKSFNVMPAIRYDGSGYCLFDLHILRRFGEQGDGEGGGYCGDHGDGWGDYFSGSDNGDGECLTSLCLCRWR